MVILKGNIFRERIRFHFKFLQIKKHLLDKMKNLCGKFCFLKLISVLILVANSSAAFAAQKSNIKRLPENSFGRISYTINENWKFSETNGAEAEKRGFADADWKAVNVPHTWNAEDAFDDTPDYRRGVSWYRKELSLNSSLKDKRIFIYFEGINQVADLYVNDRKVGRHIGGYTAFSFDVTDFVKFDEPNLLAVKVDNSFNADIPPLTADFTFYGGIYRDVWLIATDAVHLKVTDYASPGVQITTPEVSKKSAAINVRGSIVNDSPKARNVEIVNSVFDAEGKEIISVSSRLEIKPQSEANFEQATKTIPNPKLWSPDNPYLYRIQTKIIENGKTLDEISNPLGFRWFSFDGEKGFSLNGKPLKLRGANRHQDYKGLGNAVPDAVHIRDMELMKDAGYNFVRLAHYPQDPSVLQAADRLGILIWEEIPLVNYITISDAFSENAAVMLKEMIRQHRNHPSVLMWGYMNEIFLRVPKENEANIKKETVRLARSLNQLAKAEDPTRPTTIAFHGSDVYNTEGLGDIPDIIGWNLYNGWYSRTFEDFGKYIDDQHQRFPKRPLIISEYGANSDLRLHSLKPQRFDSTAEYQRMFHESYLEQINARPFIAGWTLWNEFDFGAEQRGENLPHINNKGMFTYDRKPKDVHYFYKANYSSEPVLHIATNDWRYRAGTDLSPQKIDVYSNLPEVELFLNGVSLGKKKPNDLRKATWDVSFLSGANFLKAEGSKDNVWHTDEVEVDYKLVTVNSPEIAVNVGSNAQFIDESNTVWLADLPYTKGSFGFIGSAATAIYGAPPDRNVLGSEDDPLFQTMQEGLTAYRFDVSSGTYEVELRFAETKFQKVGERVFDVKINGNTLLEKLDLVKEIGFQRAFTRKFNVAAKDGILVEFAASQGKAVLSGIRVRRL
jgi:beta-galactosidase